MTVWCLLGKKAGDNTQVRALADELDLGYEEKHILARPWELLPHLALQVTLAGIDQSQSSVLQAPWPDLVISAGRRNEPVARWIKKQSGGKTRLVHIGRPWAPLSTWDLIVTTPQYFLPQQDNIVHNSLPLHRVSAPNLEGAAGQLQPLIADLPRPYVAVLMGGDSGQFVMTVEKGARLGAMASALAEAAGGSVLATDSPRTPGPAGQAMQDALRAPHYCFRWSGDGDNPYRGILAQADAFIVTGESMSMLGEAADTGRPLFIFDVGDGDRPWWRLRHSYRYKPLSHRLAMRFGPARMRRDVGRIQDALVASGRARWLAPDMVDTAAQELKSGVQPATDEALAQQELARTAQVLRRLVIPR